MLDLINPFDREKFKETFRTTEPFPHFCIDNFLREDFAEEIYRSFPSFHEAQEMGLEFSAVNEKKKVQITDASLFPPAIKKLNDLLASPEYVDMWSELTGIDNLLADPQLVGGGIHETNTGGHLDVHVDFNYIENRQLHRRMNILIYFNKDWKEEYGGYFDIWDREVKNRHGYFKPKFNRACGFLTSDISYHGVTPITCPSDVTRKSFATYYYTSEAPRGWQGKTHSTVFKARPEEWMKGRVLMPYEKAIRSTKSTIKSMKKVVKSIVRK
jgi:Rps23 Pro-64 3,4-dihydroxylase Tpa1-like proline 4-hydroxylase